MKPPFIPALIRPCPILTVVFSFLGAAALLPFFFATPDPSLDVHIPSNDRIFILATTSAKTCLRRIPEAASDWLPRFRRSPHYGGFTYASVPNLTHARFPHLAIPQDIVEYMDSLPFRYHERASVDIGIREVI